jgi:hypothetical protein
VLSEPFLVRGKFSCGEAGDVSQPARARRHLACHQPIRPHFDPLEFMDSRVYPAEAVYDEQTRDSGDPHFQPPVIEILKAEARRRRLTNLEYARKWFASNYEVLKRAITRHELRSLTVHRPTSLGAQRE